MYNLDPLLLWLCCISWWDWFDSYDYVKDHEWIILYYLGKPDGIASILIGERRRSHSERRCEDGSKRQTRENLGPRDAGASKVGQTGKETDLTPEPPGRTHTTDALILAKGKLFGVSMLPNCKRMCRLFEDTTFLLVCSNSSVKPICRCPPGKGNLTHYQERKHEAMREIEQLWGNQPLSDPGPGLTCPLWVLNWNIPYPLSPLPPTDRSPHNR